MSSNALIWAASIAPIADVQEYAILVRMADTVDEFGCGCLLSTKSIARDLKISEKTVQRRIDAMLSRKLLAEGDQQKAVYIRADRRPTVYDLMIPSVCFASLERTNERRADLKLAPLTPQNRPIQEPAPAGAGRSPRSDIGKPRPRKVDDEQAKHGTGGGAEEQAERGDYQSEKQTGGLPVLDGGTGSPGRGDYKTPNPGVLDPGVFDPETPVRASTDESVVPVEAEAVTGDEFDEKTRQAITDLAVIAADLQGTRWPRRLRSRLDYQAARQATAAQTILPPWTVPSVTYVDNTRRRCPDHRDYPADNCAQHRIDAEIAAVEAAALKKKPEEETKAPAKAMSAEADAARKAMRANLAQCAPKIAAQRSKQRVAV